MAIRCWYCGRWFKNKKSLQAHLRWCENRKKGLEPIYNPHRYYKKEQKTEIKSSQ